MNITTKQLVSFWNPWPIIVPKGRYKVSLEEFKIACKYKSFWCQDLSISKVSSKIIKYNFLGKRHQIHSLSKYSKIEQPTIIVSKNGVILDGNHRMCSLWDRKYKGYVMVIKKK